MKIKNLLVAICIIISVVSTTSAQSQTRPRMVIVPKPELEAVTQQGRILFFYLVGPASYPIPLSRSTRLHLGLTRILSTAKMREREEYWDLPLRSPIRTPWGPLYPQQAQETTVETLIIGHESGTWDRSRLNFKPQSIVEVEIGEMDRIKVGSNDGLDIYLKPGKWSFHLDCRPESIEADGHLIWKAPSDPEAAPKWIKGPRFSSAPNSPLTAEQANEFGSINPFSLVANIIFHVANLVKAGLKRPNRELPSTADLYFYINSVEATYSSTATQTQATSSTMVVDPNKP